MGQEPCRRRSSVACRPLLFVALPCLGKVPHAEVPFSQAQVAIILEVPFSQAQVAVFKVSPPGAQVPEPPGASVSEPPGASGAFGSALIQAVSSKAHIAVDGQAPHGRPQGRTPGASGAFGSYLVQALYVSVN